MLALPRWRPAAAVVVGCSLLAERSGAAGRRDDRDAADLGGAGLCLSGAMEHDAGVSWRPGALGSLAANLANSGLSLRLCPARAALRHAALCLTAPRWRRGSARWRCSLRARSSPPSSMLLIATVAIYGGLHLLFRPYLAARPKQPPERPWYLIPMRAGFVATLAGTVTTREFACRADMVGLARGAADRALEPDRDAAAADRRTGHRRRHGQWRAGADRFRRGARRCASHGAAAGRMPLALSLGLAICIGWNLGLMRLTRGAR